MKHRDNLPISQPVLTRSQFAVIRAYYQGVSLDWIAGRYLVEPSSGASDIPDLRVVQRIILSYVDTLILIAQQHGQPALAALLEKGNASSLIGTQRLIDAVNTLEKLGKISPRSIHGVQLWFSPSLARRLIAAGLQTIGSIIEVANKNGKGWWRTVPRIGLKAAGTISHWIAQHRQHFSDHEVAEYVFSFAEPAPRSNPGQLTQNSLQLPPLEFIQISDPKLDGSAGTNRCPGFNRSLNLNTDLEAINAWLQLFSSSRSTWRSYRKEAERFLLWAIVEQGKPVSSLNSSDCLAFRKFLLNPQPARRWVGPMVQRTNLYWRPFRGPLNTCSAAFSQSVLAILCEWLVEQSYLCVNPWQGVDKLVVNHTRQKYFAGLDQSWPIFKQWLSAHTSNNPKSAPLYRVAFLAFSLSRDYGLTKDQICQLTCSNLSIDTENRFLMSPTKATKKGAPKMCLLDNCIVSELECHFRERGLVLNISSDDALISPLTRPSTRASLGKSHISAGYSVEGLHRIMKKMWAAYSSESAKRIRP